MLGTLQRFHPNLDDKDERIWRMETLGDFTVRLCYEMLTILHHEDYSWKEIWAVHTWTKIPLMDGCIGEDSNNAQPLSHNQKQKKDGESISHLGALLLCEGDLDDSDHSIQPKLGTPLRIEKLAAGIEDHGIYKDGKSTMEDSSSSSWFGCMEGEIVRAFDSYA